MANPQDPGNQNRPSFDELFDRHGRELYAYLWRMLGHRQDAEDGFQETFLRAFRTHEGLPEDSNYRAWLYKIATNVARTYIKRTRQVEALPENHEDHTQLDPLQALIDQEALQKVVAAVSQLSFRQRTAIMLRKYSDLDYSLIGEILDCSPGTARAHVYQGLQRLRVRLGQPIVAGGNGHG